MCVCVCMCVCVSDFLKPIICWWALRLFPYFGYFKYWCYERCCMYLFELGLLSFLDTCPVLRLLDHTVAVFSVFFSEISTLFFPIVAAPSCIPTNSVGGASFPPHPLQHLFCVDSNGGHSDPCEWYQIMVLSNISLINSDVEHLFMCMVVFCMCSLEKCLFRSSVCFWLVFWYWVCELFVYFRY